MRWSRGYGGDSSSDRFETVIATGGGYVAAGTTVTPSLGRRGWVVGTDETGGVEWTWRADERDMGVHSLLASDGGYAFAGGVGVDAWVGRLEADAE